MKTFLFLILWILSDLSEQSQTLTATDLLEKSIAYHDPENNWPKLRSKLTFDEKRPGNPTRHTVIWIDNTRGYFRVDRNTEVHGMVLGTPVFVEVGEVDCKRAATLRNYYVYLWGLPMKLKDEGTNLSPQVAEVTWIDWPAYELNVEYETDSWSFYFDKKTFKLIGYQFFKKSDGSGEKIVLIREEDVQGMKIPKERSWYELPDERFLGTDILLESRVY